MPPLPETRPVALPVSLSRPNASGFDPLPAPVASTSYLAKLKQDRKGMVEFTATCPTPTCTLDITWYDDVNVRRSYPGRCVCEQQDTINPVNPLLKTHGLLDRRSAA